MRLKCADCDAVMTFSLADGDEFDVVMTTPAEKTLADSGRHSADAAIEMVRKTADSLHLPDKIADRMSADPDRDAVG